MILISVLSVVLIIALILRFRSAPKPPRYVIKFVEPGTLETDLDDCLQSYLFKDRYKKVIMKVTVDGKKWISLLTAARRYEDDEDIFPSKRTFIVESTNFESLKKQFDTYQKVLDHNEKVMEYCVQYNQRLYEEQHKYKDIIKKANENNESSI